MSSRDREMGVVAGRVERGADCSPPARGAKVVVKDVGGPTSSFGADRSAQSKNNPSPRGIT
jgi:hypothetical protein